MQLRSMWQIDRPAGYLQCRSGQLLSLLVAAQLFVIPTQAQRPSTQPRPHTKTPVGIEQTLEAARKAGQPIRIASSTPLSVSQSLGELVDDVPPQVVPANPSLGVAEEAIAGTQRIGFAPVDNLRIRQGTSPPSMANPASLKSSTIMQSAAGSSAIPSAISHGPYGGQLETYRLRAAQLPSAAASDPSAGQGGGTVSFGMWWEDAVASPLGISGESMPIDVANLTQVALQSSPYVQGILTEPQIRRSDLVIADSEFDSSSFVEAKFADTNEPVGSALTTGDNSDRFRDETFSSAAGLRKKTRAGASLELAQRGGFQDNNSTFLIPNPQGTTRLEINFTQPLLKDGGRAVNNTRVMLAKIDVAVADSEVRTDLEDHLIDVTRAYWELFQARAEWLQRNRLLEGATKLHDILVARDGVDSLQRQILRAHVAVTSRRSDLIRAETRIRNAQAQLRLLTGSPQLIQASRWELTPQDRPLAFPVQISTREATVTALDNRPDIAQAIRKIQSVSARVGAAKNQVLPRLDLILSTYVSGLDDKTDTFGAFANQFSEGRPSYAAGLLFEMPIGNRASKARLNRNRWELTRTMYEFQQTTEVAFADVEIAVRETKTTFNEMLTKKQAIDAASTEVAYLQQRWQLLPDPNESAVLLIEDLLDAQERLADEERAFVTSQVAYALSWVQLRKAMGVLLRFDNPSHSPLIADRSPLQETHSPGAAAPGNVVK